MLKEDQPHLLLFEYFLKEGAGPSSHTAGALAVSKLHWRRKLAHTAFHTIGTLPKLLFQSQAVPQMPYVQVQGDKN